MDLYENCTLEEKKREVRNATMDILYDVIPNMIAEVVLETLEEERNPIPDEFALFDLIFDWNEEAGTLTEVRAVADETLEETSPPPVPSLEDNEAPSSPSNPTEQEENNEMEEEEHRRYVMERRNTNTIKKTESVLRKVRGYFKAVLQEERDILDIPPKKLASLMSSFILGVRKPLKKGVTMENATNEQKYHQPDTLTSYWTGVARYCRENNYPVNIITDDTFTLFRKVLETRRCELKEMGLGNHPQAAVPLSDEDVELCWQSGAFGDSTPRTLQNTMYFFLSNAYGWRTRDEQYEACWGDIKIIDEGTENEHLKWNERTSKTRKGRGPPRKFNPNMWAIQDQERCPVRLWKMWRDRRTETQKHAEYKLFLTPNFHATWDMKLAYKHKEMSEGSLGRIMLEVKESAGLTGAIKGHSVRKTCATNLIQQGIPPTQAIQVTGHANVNSLNNYSTASMAQQREMSDILVGGKRPANDRLASNIARKRPAAAAGSARDLDILEDAVVEDPEPVQQVAPVPAPGPAPMVLAPQMASAPLQPRLAQDLGGMFAGATIQGNVHVHIHYGHVASNTTSTTEVTLSQEMPQAEIL